MGFSLLDADGAGVVSREEMAFLEKDKAVRKQTMMDLNEIAQSGSSKKDGAGKSDAEKYLHETLRRTTQVGRKHWSMTKHFHETSSSRCLLTSSRRSQSS